MAVLAWYLVLIVGSGLVETAKDEYAAVGTLVLLPASAPMNPFGSFSGSVDITAQVIAEAAASDRFVDRVVALGGAERFTVEKHEDAPILIIETTSLRRDQAVDSVDVIAGALADELRWRQQRLGVAADDQLTVDTVVVPERATVVETARNRATVIIVAFGLWGMVASAVIADRLALERARRRRSEVARIAAARMARLHALLPPQKPLPPIPSRAPVVDWLGPALPAGEPMSATDEPVLGTTAMADARMDGIRRDALSGVAWSLVQSWGARIVSTAAFVVLARALVPSDFGVVALAVVFIDLGQTLITRGFGATIIQRPDLTDEDLDSAFWFAIAAGIGLGSICVATAGLVADAFDEPRLAPVLRVLALNWLFGALSSVPQNVLQRQLKFRILAIRRLSAVLISGAVGIVLAVTGAGVWSLVAMTLTQSAVGVIVLWTVSSWRPRWRLSADRLRGMRRFAAAVVAIDLIRFFGVRGESILVGAVLSPIALGYYAVATRFLLLLNEVFTATIGSVAFPVFSRLQDDVDRRRRVLFTVVRMCAAAAFPAFCGLAAIAPELIHTALGGRWDPSVVLTQLLALHGLRYAITYFIANVVLSTGNATMELRLTIIGVFIQGVALAIGVQWGVQGVAWAVVTTSYATLPISLWALRRTTGITAREYLANVARPALAAAMMVVAIVSVRPAVGPISDSVMLVLLVAVGAVTYVAALAVVAPGLFRELRSFVTDVMRRPHRSPSGQEALQP